MPPSPPPATDGSEPPLQDQLFAEAWRVLRPGGTFTGYDGVAGLPLRLVHLGDVYNPVPPGSLRGRLRRAGFGSVTIRAPERGRQRWSARKDADDGYPTTGAQRLAYDFSGRL